MHPIHKHMSSRMKARKSDERYDAKMAYDKKLSGKARLHYLENDIADKGMSMKAPMDMKAPMQMGHEAPSMKSPMEKESPKQERKNLMKDNPIDKDASGKRKSAGELAKKAGKALAAGAMLPGLGAAGIAAGAAGRAIGKKLAKKK